MGDGELDQHSDEVTVEELRGELEDLRTLVHTLLTIIMEEADGVQSVSYTHLTLPTTEAV